MRRVSDGYTIIEVMIFLAISLVIAAASWSLISGKQAQTDFNQKMRDTQSKLQDWINDVSTGFSGGDPSQQYCKIGAGNRPAIQSGTAPAGYTPDCIFLGKAIQFTDSSFNSGVQNQDSTLYAYPVFGCRLASCNASGSLSGSMDDANPEPAVGQNSSVPLTETFDLTPAYVKSVCGKTPSSVGCTGSHLIGFMNSFNNNPTENGAENLDAYLYSLNSGNALPADQASSSVLPCIEGNVVGGPCPISQLNQNPPPLTSFDFCLTDGSRTAEVTITSNAGIGASVSLKYESC